MSIEIRQQGNEWRIVLLNEQWKCDSIPQALKTVEQLMTLKDLVGDPEGRKNKKKIKNEK